MYSSVGDFSRVCHSFAGKKNEKKTWKVVPLCVLDHLEGQN